MPVRVVASNQVLPENTAAETLLVISSRIFQIILYLCFSERYIFIMCAGLQCFSHFIQLPCNRSTIVGSRLNHVGNSINSHTVCAQFTLHTLYRTFQTSKTGFDLLSQTSNAAGNPTSEQLYISINRFHFFDHTALSHQNMLHTRFNARLERANRIAYFIGAQILNVL